MILKTTIFKLIVLFILGPNICDGKRYENYTLYRGIPTVESHLEFLQNLSNVYDVNYWREPGSLRMPVDFVIGPQHREMFWMEATRKGLDLTTIMEDVQSAFDKQTVKSYIRRRMDSFDWHNYYTIDDINTWLKDLAKAFPQEVFIESIGKTHENRDILAVNVVLKGCLKRSKVIIEGGIHAREWISPAFVTYMLHKIVYSAISADKVLRLIAKTYEWTFVPILNPDGYEYSHKMDRLWRKNRHGEGTDLNRNFGFAFGSEGISFNEYSEVYCGKTAFSEKESKAMSEFIKTKSGTLEYYLSFHSYGQYMIIPYAHSSKHVGNYDEMRSMGQAAAAKIKSFYRKKYAVGTAYETVGYKVSGASTCWVKHTFGVPYVMTIELRDEGSYGFALPTDQILQTCEETLAGMLTLLMPQSKTYEHKDISKEDLRHPIVLDGQGRKFLDRSVFIFNMVVFIILRLY